MNRSADGTAHLTFQVTNEGTAPALLVQCGDQPSRTVEQWDGANWAEYTADVCPAIYANVPVPLAPGASRAGGVALAAPGRYRVRIEITSAPSDTARRTVASDPFEVR